MKIALVVLALSLTAEHALVQTEARRGFIGLGIGPSTPFGTFASTSANNPRVGRAFPGYTDTFLNLGYRAGTHFGVAAAYSYSEFVMRDGGDDDWWQVANLMIGPMYTHPLSARAAIDLKAMLGLTAMTPVIDSYSTTGGTGGSLGVDLRATVRYDVLRRWAVFAEGGVQASNVSFNSGARTDYRAVISGIGLAFRPEW
jgi:hypothetical protein